MDIVFSQDPRDFARRDWSALVTADPAGTVFHTPAFLKLYWEEFADLPTTSCSRSPRRTGTRSARSRSNALTGRCASWAGPR